MKRQFNEKQYNINNALQLSPAFYETKADTEGRRGENHAEESIYS